MNTADFTAFLREMGLRPRVVAADGRIRRCPTESKPKSDNGAYMLAADGRYGWLQDWATHAEPVVWRPESGASPLPPPDLARVRRERERADRERRHAVERARYYFAECVPLLGGHPYLARKGLGMEGCTGLRVDARGWLVVPMLLRGELVSVQRIDADGSKRFWKGGPTRGTRFTIERPGATLTVLVEGLATGLALFAAVPTARVVVAFSANNLARVAEALPRRGLYAVAADNDHGTAQRIGRNPGVEAAHAAAAVLGCGVAIPSGIAGTDWCDLRAERVAARLATRAFGREQREASVRRAVDAEIARAIQSAARFAPFAAVAG